MAEKDLEREYPYYFCPQCNRLSPVQILNGSKFCLKCAYSFDSVLVVKKQLDSTVAANLLKFKEDSVSRVKVEADIKAKDKLVKFLGETSAKTVTLLAAQLTA